MAIRAAEGLPAVRWQRCAGGACTPADPGGQDVFPAGTRTAPAQPAPGKPAAREKISDCPGRAQREARLRATTKRRRLTWPGDPRPDGLQRTSGRRGIGRAYAKPPTDPGTADRRTQVAGECLVA